jgi:nucleoside-diphosphate-sugar epimerase
MMVLRLPFALACLPHGAVMTIVGDRADGFIGRHLVRVLADAGCAVHGIGHGAIEDVDRERIGLREWLNGQIDNEHLDYGSERFHCALFGA